MKILSSVEVVILYRRDKMAEGSEKTKIDIAYLLEKYGPKNKKKTDTSDDGKPKKPEYLKDGFCIRFRLSKAYRLMEKQEVDAARPDVSSRDVISSNVMMRLMVFF